MKNIVLFLLLLSSSICSYAGQNSGFVSVQNNELRDGNNKKIYLDGVSLGNWLLWEGWMMGGGFDKESLIKTRLKELLGESAYRNFLNQYYHNYVTEKDIEQIAAHGFNSIRLPINYRILESGGDVNGFALIDNLVTWCKKYKVFLILDLHAAPGGQNPYFISDPSGVTLWESEANRKRTLEIWQNIAQRYRNERIIAGYDLLNEPQAKNSKLLISFYEEIINTIRVQDKNHLVIVEGNALAKDFTGFPAKMDDNQIYSYHYYPWFSERNKSKFIQSITRTINSKLPLWCGEWGEDTAANLREARAVIKQQPADAGMSFWTWKRVNKNDDRLPLYSVKTGDNWQKVINWVARRRIFKPSRGEITKGINEYLRAIELDNSTFNASTNAVFGF